MKYFLPEYLDIYSPDITNEEIEQKNLKWENSCKEYRKYIQKNAGLFQKSFLNEYRKQGFHDYKIKNIHTEFENYKNKEIKMNIIVHLESKGTDYFLISKDVKNYSSSVNIEMKHSQLINDYLNGEYYRDEQRLWHHNFLFGFYFEINITSKKFIFKKSDDMKKDYDHSYHWNPATHPHDENGGHYHDWDWSDNKPWWTDRNRGLD